MFVFNENLF